MTVHDSGNPDVSAMTTVQVPVTRNVNAPRFSQETYEMTINENAAVGSALIDVLATDVDGVSVCHRYGCGEHVPHMWM